MRGAVFFIMALASTTAFVPSRSTRPQFQLNGQSQAQEPMSPRDDQVKQAAKAAKMTGAAFLSLAQAEMQAARAQEEGVEKTTESGLKYVDTKVGDGASPVPGDTVRVHYTGWLESFESEKKFDSSYDRRSPLVFRVGTGQVIKGWDEALLTDMKVGTVRNVIIPAALGYGSRGAGGVIPPGATLYFKMELVGIGAR
jgi:peptidylprolyl isomerase